MLAADKNEVRLCASVISTFHTHRWGQHPCDGTQSSYNHIFYIQHHLILGLYLVLPLFHSYIQGWVKCFPFFIHIYRDESSASLFFFIHINRDESNAFPFSFIYELTHSPLLPIRVKWELSDTHFFFFLNDSFIHLLIFTLSFHICVNGVNTITWKKGWVLCCA
jgi:hypothetical protein